MSILKEIKYRREDAKYIGKKYKVSYEDFYPTDFDCAKFYYSSYYAIEYPQVMDDLGIQDDSFNYPVFSFKKTQPLFSKNMENQETVLIYLGDGIFIDLITGAKVLRLVNENEDGEFSKYLNASRIINNKPVDSENYPIGVRINNMNDYEKNEVDITYTEEECNEIYEEYKKAVSKVKEIVAYLNKPHHKSL